MTATVTKIADAQVAGTYTPTSVDAARAAADIVVTGYVRSRTEFVSSKLLSGPGIKLVRNTNGVGLYTATEEAMTELRRRFTVATDF